MHATDIRIRDLILERRRNQDVDVLFEPCRPVQHVIPQSGSLCAINPAEFICDADKGVRIQAASAPERVCAPFDTIPGSHRDHGASECHVSSDCVLCDFPKALDAGERVFGANADLPQRLL